MNLVRAGRRGRKALILMGEGVCLVGKRGPGGDVRDPALPLQPDWHSHFGANVHPSS
jgi:hypothetical protein